MNYPYLVRPSQIEEVWPKVEKLIADACEYNSGRYRASDCLKELLSNEKQLWIVFNESGIRSVVTTAIIPFPGKRVCIVDICTGEGLDEWLQFFPLVEQWAVENGCSQMLLHARPGLERKLRDYDYHKTHVVLEKELNKPVIN